jgi:hypothetical protein
MSAAMLARVRQDIEDELDQVTPGEAEGATGERPVFGNFGLPLTQAGRGGDGRVSPREQLQEFMLEMQTAKPAEQRFDLWKWLCSKQQRWPDLWKIMMDVLMRPCTSVETERFFSLCGRIASTKRMCLTQEKIEALALISANEDISTRFLTAHWLRKVFETRLAHQDDDGARIGEEEEENE